MGTMTTASENRSPKFRLSSAAFLVAILLFLLPFVDIRCNGQSFATNTGIGLAFGTSYKTTSQLNSEGDRQDKKISITEKQSGKMYVSALIALLLGVAGLVLSVTNPGNKINGLMGVLAAVALVALFIQIKYDVRDRSAHDLKNGLGIGSHLKVTASFTAWYYLSLVSFIAAAFFSYWRKRIIVSA